MTYDPDMTVEEIGSAFLGWITAMAALGHASPRGGLDYLAVEEGSASALVRDFVACTIGHPGLVPGSKERLHALAHSLLVELARRQPPQAAPAADAPTARRVS